MVKYNDSFLQAFDRIKDLRGLSLEEKRALLRDILETPFLDLTDDVAFKYTFGSHPELLRSLLNDMLPERIASLEYIPNEIPRRNPKDRKAIFDVICKTVDGRRILVEMQRARETDFKDRLFFYGASLVHSQMRRGDKEYRLMPVYVICLMNFSLHQHNDYPGKYMFVYHTSEDETHERYGSQLAFYLFELPRVVPVSDNPVSEWLHYIREMRNFAHRPANLPPKFVPLFDLSEKEGMSPEELIDYMTNILTKDREKRIAKANYDFGREEGLAEGKAEGLVEGEAKGRAEALKATAIQLLQMGLSVPDVAKATGLAVEEITRLQN